jgi:hypothetical protein
VRPVAVGATSASDRTAPSGPVPLSSRGRRAKACWRTRARSRGRGSFHRSIAHRRPGVPTGWSFPRCALPSARRDTARTPGRARRRVEDGYVRRRRSDGRPRARHGPRLARSLIGHRPLPRVLRGTALHLKLLQWFGCSRARGWRSQSARLWLEGHEVGSRLAPFETGIGPVTRRVTPCWCSRLRRFSKRLTDFENRESVYPAKTPTARVPRGKRAYFLGFRCAQRESRSSVGVRPVSSLNALLKVARDRYPTS